MNHDYDKQLERRIDRALKGLPELAAPATLQARVMAAIERRASLPWYKQSWEMWPAALRYASMAVLLGLFGGLCYASWELTRAAGTTAAMQEVGSLFSGVIALWSAVKVLLGAVLLVVKQMGTTFIIACLLAAGLGYAMCVGLGTFYLRVALARR